MRIFQRRQAIFIFISLFIFKQTTEFRAIFFHVRWMRRYLESLQSLWIHSAVYRQLHSRTQHTQLTPSHVNYTNKCVPFVWQDWCSVCSACIWYYLSERKKHRWLTTVRWCRMRSESPNYIWSGSLLRRFVDRKSYARVVPFLQEFIYWTLPEYIFLLTLNGLNDDPKSRQTNLCTWHTNNIKLAYIFITKHMEYVNAGIV